MWTGIREVVIEYALTYPDALAPHIFSSTGASMLMLRAGRDHLLSRVIVPNPTTHWVTRCNYSAIVVFGGVMFRA